MANTFFTAFPIINYALPGTSPSGISNGTSVINIVESVKLDPQLVGNSYFFTNIGVSDGGVRSDQLALQVYGDPNLDWVIWISNQTIDPYDWYLDNFTFYTYVNDKYDDYDLAQQKVVYYINNWYNGANLAVDGFDALDPSLTKYYQPQIAPDGITILQYVRTPVDWTIQTNHMLQFVFNNANTTLSNDFITNEICTVTWDSLGNTVNGQLVSIIPISNTQTLFTIQHLLGNYEWWQTGSTNSLAFSILGTQSNAIVIMSSNNALANVSQYDAVGPLEDVYYDPMTQFDVENQLNQSRKNLTTINQGFLPTVVQQLEGAF